MPSDKAYMAKENARLQLQSAVEHYLATADRYEMGAQETADEMSDIFINLSQPYRVETTE